MTTASPTAKRYEFGKNWTRFVKKSASDERVDIAKRHILTFVGRDNLDGLDFLDIGCGSGIHSLAAHQAGAGKIHGFDYDEDSVNATNIMRRRAGEPQTWTVERGDVLNDEYISSLGKWNLVYSWGVLHHTGDVWHAIENASKTVAKGGLFYIALYSEDVQRDPQFWLDVKRRYNEASQLRRWFMEWWYVWNFVMGRNPFKLAYVFVRIFRHRLTRGMSFFADIRDWLGGWPMEFTRDADVINYLAARGFERVKVKTGQACTEFLFRCSV
jgi:2-polyprenyl-6-hydroxyphenyl methylase/3-demethylubiquinone-9 3-methyltransferase